LCVCRACFRSTCSRMEKQTQCCSLLQFLNISDGCSMLIVVCPNFWSVLCWFLPTLLCKLIWWTWSQFSNGYFFLELLFVGSNEKQQ
jgi:hypothetical protein